MTIEDVKKLINEPRKQSSQLWSKAFNYYNLHNDRQMQMESDEYYLMVYYWIKNKIK